jgi:SAM-dependent methyltransferase
MTLLVPARRSDPEWLDRTDNAPQDIENALRDIAWVNRSLGGARALLRAMDPFLADAPPGAGLEILDIGTGGGDLAATMVSHGRSRGRPIRVTAVDRDPVAAAFAERTVRTAREAGQASDDIRVIRADASSLPFRERSFDLVTASLFLHHFRHKEAAALLSSFRRLARRAVIINELHRHRVPWLFISVAARATRRSPMFVHDAALSVLRGFTETELHALARDAGAPDASVLRSWPFRLLLVLPPAA